MHVLVQTICPLYNHGREYVYVMYTTRIAHLMDDQKDIQKIDVLARFIDDQTIRTNPFGANRAAERLYRRVERIIAGVYLLTSHIPPGETLRERVRGSVLDLADAALDLKEEMRAPESVGIHRFNRAARHVVTLVRAMTAGGFISFQNADAVISALDELGTFIVASQRTSFSDDRTFSKDDFIGHMGPLEEPSTMSFIKDIKDIRNLKDTRVIKDTVQTSRQTISTNASRTAVIIQILRGGSEFGIKDICARVPEYSEKTVQRELAALVQDGKVKKIGLKRWSKYSLVSDANVTSS